MFNKPFWYRLMLTLLVFTSIAGLLGCSAFDPASSETAPVTFTVTETSTPKPTKTITLTAVPSKTSTLTLRPTRTGTPTRTSTSTPTPIDSVPTSALNGQEGVISMAETCRSAVDKITAYHSGLDYSDYLAATDSSQHSKPYDPNRYFAFLTHLSMAPGYVLDAVYYGDDLGGMPLLYARLETSAPFSSYEDYYNSLGLDSSNERSYSTLGPAYRYLDYVWVDQTPQSYFQFITLVYLGGQVRLYWHGLYNDTKILCDSSDLTYVQTDMDNFGFKFPENITQAIPKIDFTPEIIMDEETVTVRFVTFSKWGGFNENIYTLLKKDPYQVFWSSDDPIIEYDCGARF